MSQLRTFLVVAGLSLNGCAAGDHSADDVAIAAEVVDVGARAAGAGTNAARCALPAFTSRGPALSAFADFVELDAYVVSATAACIEAAPTWPPPGPLQRTAVTTPESTSEGGLEHGSSSMNATVRIGDLLLVSTPERLFVVDVSVPNAPRQLDAQDVSGGPATMQMARKLELHVVDNLIYVVRRVDDLGGSIPIDWRPQEQGWSGAGQGQRWTAPWAGIAIMAFRLHTDTLERIGERFIEVEDRPIDTDSPIAKVIDGQLSFYMNYPIANRYQADASRGIKFSRATLPRILTPDAPDWHTSGRPLLEARDVQRPLSSVREPTLHAMVRCAVGQGREFACSARGWIGRRLSQVHLASSHAYVWTDDHVYAASHAPFAVTAHRIAGAPISSRSMTEIGETLHVAVESTVSAGTLLSMWSLPRSAFDARGEQDDGARVDVTTVEHDGAKVLAELFVGSKYVASVYTYLPERLATRVIYDLATREPPHTDLTQAVHHSIESLGGDRVLFVGGSTVDPFGRTMSLEVWKLDGKPGPIAQLTLPDTTAVWNGHYFFARQTVDATCTRFALPLMRAAKSTELDDAWLGIFEVQPGGLKLFGARAPARVQPLPAAPCVGVCDASVFAADGVQLGERVFAHQGSLLVELGLDPLTELGRVKLAPPTPSPR